jgi:hypothetical protein
MKSRRDGVLSVILIAANLFPVLFNMKIRKKVGHTVLDSANQSTNQINSQLVKSEDPRSPCAAAKRA